MSRRIRRDIHKRVTSAGYEKINGDLEITGALIGPAMTNVTTAIQTLTAGTTTPVALTITRCEGAFKAIILQWLVQYNLVNFDHYEIQVSSDDTNWYSLQFDGTDWKDTLNADTDWVAPMLVHIPIPFGGTEAAPTAVTLYYRMRQATKADVKSAWSASVNATTSVLQTGDIAADNITANKVEAAALQALFAKIAFALTVGFGGSGTYDAPVEGDRRAYIDGDEVLLQEYTEGAWSTVNGVKIGGAVAGIFLSLLGCRWLVNPEVEITAAENELFPGPGELFALDNSYLNQYGVDTFSAHTSLSFTTSPKKFGTHALTCTDPTYNGALVTAADAVPKYPHAMSAWIYSGSSFSAMNWEMGWNFGWDGVSATYGSYIRLEIGSTGNVRLYWHDDYDDTGGSQLIGSLTAATWYHFGLIWDYDNDQVVVVVNGTATTVAIYNFNELGLRSSELVRSTWILDKDKTHVIDDLAVVKNVLADADVFVQHYNHNVPWSQSTLNAKDLILRPAEGGRVMAQTDAGVITLASDVAGVADTKRIVAEYIFDEGHELNYTSSLSDGMAAAAVTFTELPSNTVAVLARLLFADSSTSVGIAWRRSSGGTQTFHFSALFADGGVNTLRSVVWMPTSGNSIYVTAVDAGNTHEFKIVGYKVGA